MASVLDERPRNPYASDPMDQNGLLQWANSIRFNMANDNGRQLFQQQVQTHGFLFLDDYLDNILSGGKQDPLIELVKTPGRRKVLSKKPKLGSKLGNPILFPLDTTIEEPVPAPSEASGSGIRPKLDLENPHEQDRNTNAEAQPSADASAPRTLAVPVKNTHLDLSPLAQPKDLSIIAEDDEPETASANSNQILSPSKPAEEGSDDRLRDTSPSSKVENYHSSQSARPSEYHSAQATPKSPTFPPIPSPPTTADIQDAAPSDKMVVSPKLLSNKPLPVVPPEPEMEITDMQVPLKDEDSTAKSGVMSIPSLPEPAPLRKSTRVLRDPSLGPLYATTTPGPPGGKRTSWLMKAREVKALDNTVKKTPAIQPSQTPAVPSTSSKRKSDDIGDGRGAMKPWDSEERKPKVTKVEERDTAPVRSQPEPVRDAVAVQPQPLVKQELPSNYLPSPQGVLDRLKKTVEGLGLRAGVTGRPDESSVARTFAEAKAAAQARIAERNKEDEPASQPEPSSSKFGATMGKMEVDLPPVSSAKEARLSMSDLFPSGSKPKEKHRVPDKVFSPVSLSPKSPQTKSSARDSTTTTPPHSPPPSHPAPPHPAPSVFQKPPPQVFVPPAPKPLPSPPAKEFTFAPPRSQTAVGLGLANSPPFTAFKPPAPLTAQSTVDSIRSESIFDRADEAATWVPSTQDTEYTTFGQSQSQGGPMTVCDEDDSWPVDEKLAEGVQWSYGGAMSKEDTSMTWSTVPSQSTRADTGPLTKSNPSNVEEKQENRAIPGAFDMDIDDRQSESEDDAAGDSELEDIVLSAPKPSSQSSQNAEKNTFKPQSQTTMASSSSTQSQGGGGFLNQASKLFSSALGGSNKKPQPEVKKVLQMAAVAAKKQQEEADKKAARLEEMEKRRQAALQRKAEEEKAKQLEEERKAKDEAERRKQKEATEKKVVRPAPSKKEDEPVKAKVPEPAKKSILKKTASGTLGKSQLTKPSALKSTASFSNLATPQAGPSNAASSTKPAEVSKLPKATPASVKGKGKAPVEDDVSQPSQLLHDQMAARAKAKIKAAKKSEPLVPSESIELPDINSEYSDSEDEDRPRTFDPPDWAQSPELKAALSMQSQIDPDSIFGPVPALVPMQELFPGRSSRFRARTSSANWTGTDMLTKAEELDYAKRMGFKK